MKLVMLIMAFWIIGEQRIQKHQDYILNYNDRAMKKMSSGTWLRLNEGGKGAILEWGHCNVIWKDSLSWTQEKQFVTVTLKQDHTERILEAKRNCLVPTFKDNVFIDEFPLVNKDTLRFNRLFKDFFLNNKVPCYN